MKVALFALDSIDNGGDEMLGDTAAYLIRRAAPGSEICRYQLLPDLKDVWRYAPVKSFIGAVLLKIVRYRSGNLRHLLYDLAFNIKYRAYYEHCLRHADKAVYACGMLKFASQDFSHVYKLINRTASRRGISVLMNAMSIARPNEKDVRYAHVVEAVNEKSVKMVTTRDGSVGLERLRRCYVTRNDVVTDYVGDPALWAPECYGVKKKASVATGKLRLGINLIRCAIYESYNGGMTRDEVYAFYKEFITAARKEFDVTLFCNGMQSDYVEGERLVKELELPREILMPRPQSARELAEIISGFDVVFGARLHACITSVALGVPVAGLLWDDKLKFFSQSMGIAHLFTEHEDLTSETIIKKLHDAYAHPFDFENRERYKQKTLRAIQQFLG